MQKQIKRLPGQVALDRRLGRSPLWRLSHHKHSFRVLPHSHTSYPVIAMLLLLTGVMISGWTRVSEAATGQYTVHASVPGTPPAQAATIDLPANGAHVSTRPIYVAGSCPVGYGTYVDLLRNNTASGTALCDNTGHYNIQTDLFDGRNEFVATVKNFAGTAGPISNTRAVFYDPPVTNPGGSKAGTTTTKPTSDEPASYVTATPAAVAEHKDNPMLLTTDYTVRGFYVGEPATLSVGLDGGIGPYIWTVDWGDGSVDSFTRDTVGSEELSHRYHHHGDYRGGYAISVTVADASGNKTGLQLLALINDRPTAGAATGAIDNGGGNGSFIGGASDNGTGGLQKYIAPVYGTTVLMAGSFWLGELRQLKYAKVLAHHPLHIRRK